MSYVRITDFTAKDALLSGDPLKGIKGTELGSEFDAIAAADALNTKSATLAATSGSSLVGFIQAGTGAATDTVQDELRETTGIWQFGAAGDGVTDDGAAFVLAAARLSDGTFTELDLGNKTYVISSTAQFDVNAAPGRVKIYGRGAKIVFKDGAAARPFVIRNCTGVEVSGIEFNSTSRTVGAYNNLDVMNCSNVDVHHNTLKGANFYGCAVVEDTIGGTSAVCNNVKITHNLFINCGNTEGIAVECFPKVKSRDLLVQGNVFYDCGSSTTATLKAGAAYEQAVIRDNLIYAPRGMGIAVATWESTVIENNDIIDYGTIAISASVNTHPSYLTPTLASLILRGNRLSFSSGSAATGVNSISVNGDQITNGQILLEGNYTLRGNGGFIFRPVAAVPNIVVRGNKFVSLIKTASYIYSDAASGAAPASLVVENNYMENNDLTRTAAMMGLSACTNSRITDNTIVRGGNQSISLTSCDGSYVQRNVIFEPNVANTASVGCINVTDSAAVNYYIKDNKIITGVNGHPKAIYSGNNATPTIYLEGNTSDDVAVLTVSSGTPTIYVGGASPFAQYGKARHFYGTAAPVAGGVYVAGDMVWNTSPAASQPPGWCCTVGGSPGTWKAMANLAA